MLQMLVLQEQRYTIISGCKRGVMQTMDFLIHYFLDGKESHVLCKTSVRKIVNDGLSKILVRAMPYGAVWVDKRSLFVVSGVANIEQTGPEEACIKMRGS